MIVYDLNTFFNIISRFKTQNYSNNWFFIVCSCDSKSAMDSNVLSNFNLELEIKVSFFLYIFQSDLEADNHQNSLIAYYFSFYDFATYTENNLKVLFRL